GGEYVLILWDLQKGQEVRRLSGHTNEVRGAAVSADGRRVVSASSDGTLGLWDLETGRQVRSMTVGPGLLCVALSRKGRLALVGSWESMVQLWDVEAGRLIRRFEGHKGVTRGVAFSPDERRAVSANTDGTA